MFDSETQSEPVQHDREIEHVTSRLAHELDEPQRETELRPAVESDFRRFDNARVREFVPVFVERRLRADLRALVQM